MTHPYRSLRQRWQTVPRWLRWPLLGLVGLYLAYVLAANVFLNTGLAPWAINRKPEKFTLHWDWATSVWPGRVDVHGPRLRGHVRQTRWWIDAERARGHIFMTALFARQVHMPDIEADNVTGGTRHDEGPPIVADRPVPGKKSWSLRFDRIHTDSVRGGQFGSLRFSGFGSAEMGFTKRLRSGPMRVMPSWARVGQVRLANDQHELLTDGRFDAKFSMDPHTRAQAQGLDKLGETVADLRLIGHTTGVSLQPDAQGRPVFRAAPGSGKADLDVRWVRGELASGSRAQWTAPLLGRDAQGKPLQGEMDLRLNVDDHIALKAHVPAAAPDALQLDADLQVRGRQVPLRDFASVLERTSGSAQGRWRFASLDWIKALFPKTEWLQLRGEGVVEGKVQLRDGRLVAGSQLKVPEMDASATVMSSYFAGRASADLHVESSRAGADLPVLLMRMQRFVVTPQEDRRTPYIEGNDLRLDLRTLAPDATVADLRRDTRAHLVFRDARVPDLRTYNRYLPRDQLGFEGGTGKVSGDLYVLPGGVIGDGRIQLQAQAARLRVAGLALQTDLDADIQLRRAELKQALFDLDESIVELRNVGFTGSRGEQRSGWWARARIEHGRLDWSRPIDVDTQADLQMRDVGFLMALYAQKRDFPQWIDNVVDAGETRVRGRVHWHDDTLTLDNLAASNDRFDVLARLRLQGDQPQGSLYAKWGLLSAALELSDGRRQWHLLGARKWYDEQGASAAAPE
ncbi:MAG TPA: hypothetical protein VGC74_06950 [Stenotrophomonas sp.]|jgi:hypothetical protein